MTEKKEERERIRKEYAPDGTRGQRMINFRMDIDLWEIVAKQPNKGRFVNDAIRAYSQK